MRFLGLHLCSFLFSHPTHPACAPHSALSFTVWCVAKKKESRASLQSSLCVNLGPLDGIQPNLKWPTCPGWPGTVQNMGTPGCLVMLYFPESQGKAQTHSPLLGHSYQAGSKQVLCLICQILRGKSGILGSKTQRCNWKAWCIWGMERIAERLKLVLRLKLLRTLNKREVHYSILSSWWYYCLPL